MEKTKVFSIPEFVYNGFYYDISLNKNITHLTDTRKCVMLVIVGRMNICRSHSGGNRYMMLKKNRDLEALLERINNNMANNYKDAAQDYLKQYETKLGELLKAGALKDKQKAYYESLLGSYKERMKEFRHKDQKPYWT